MGSEASRWLKWDCPYFGPLLLSTLITPFQIMSIISIFKVNQLSNLDFFFNYCYFFQYTKPAEMQCASEKHPYRTLEVGCEFAIIWDSPTPRKISVHSNTEQQFYYKIMTTLKHSK